MKRFFVRLIVFGVVILLCCGCAKESLDPQIPYGLLIKGRDFLSFCIFLADQEKPYYNHIAQRYYYAMLSIASITYQWNKGHGVVYKKVKHEEVWQLMPHDVKTYGESLRELRRRCDYRYEDDSWNQEGFKRDLASIVCDKDKMFSQLASKVRTDYQKFIGKAVVDDPIKVEDCDAILKEIEELHNKLTSRIS